MAATHLHNKHKLKDPPIYTDTSLTKPKCIISLWLYFLRASNTDQFSILISSIIIFIQIRHNVKWEQGTTFACVAYVMVKMCHRYPMAAHFFHHSPGSLLPNLRITALIIFHLMIEYVPCEFFFWLKPNSVTDISFFFRLSFLVRTEWSIIYLRYCAW